MAPMTTVKAPAIKAGRQVPGQGEVLPGPGPGQGQDPAREAGVLSSKGLAYVVVSNREQVDIARAVFRSQQTRWSQDYRPWATEQQTSLKPRSIPAFRRELCRSANSHRRCGVRAGLNPI